MPPPFIRIKKQNMKTNYIKLLKLISNKIKQRITLGVFFVLLILNGNTLDAQNVSVVNSGINISSGTYITTNGNVTISGTAILNDTGTVILGGNWTNTGTYNSSGGTVYFSGNTSQSISGTNSFANLYINNGAGVSLNNDITVSSYLEFDNGNITTGSNVVTIDSNAVGAPIAGFINGNAREYLPAGIGASASFPIGTGTTYTQLDLFVDNVTTGGYVTAHSTPTDHPNIATSGFNPNLTINRYWTVTNGGVVFDQFTLGLMYADADRDAGVIDNYLGVKEYSAGSWSDLSNSVNSSDYESVSSVTSFGDFQLGQINPIPQLFTISPIQGSQGDTLNVVFNGANYINGSSTVNTGSGITVNSISISGDTMLTANITISLAAALGPRQFSVTNSGPGGGTSDSVTFTVTPVLPTASFIATTLTIQCNADGTTTFNNYSSNATSYTWNFGAGAIPATVTGFGPYTVSYSTTGLKTVRLIATNANGSDTLTRSNYITVTSLAPVTPGSISGPAGVCNYVGTTAVYNCPNVNGATSYNWTVPVSTTIISGQGTALITLFYPTNFVTGNISVVAQNGCGNSAARTIGVSAVPPVTPAGISGLSVVCNVTYTTYTVLPPAGTGSYNWTVPSQMTIISGQGTTALHVNISPGNFTGYVTVQALGVCGNSGIDTLLVSKKPASPSAISGPSSVCSQITATYKVPPVVGATSYAWILPSGMTFANGAGTDSINVNITSGFITGSISVTAQNACGYIAGVSLVVFGHPPLAPASISGPTAVCGIPSLTYTCASSTAASSYFWTAPAGMLITSGQGTTSVTVSNTTFTTGSITVAATDICGTGTARALALNTISIAPGTITGPAITCGITSTTYSIAPVTGSTGYNWTVPAGVTITNNTGTSINVNIIGTFSGGSISLTSTNGCNTSVAKTLLLSKFEPTPGIITGPANVCGMTSETYSIAAEAGATSYSWTIVQTGGLMTINSGQGTTAIIAHQPGTTMNAATVKVAAVNACGSSASKSLAIASCASPIGMNNTLVDVTTNNYSEVYPNPASQEFTIDITTDMDKAVYVEVYDILGNILVRESHTITNGIVNTMKTNIEKFKNGIYLVRLLDDNGNVLNTQRVVKQ